MMGNFSVKKSSVPFTSLGVDYALEQENRRLKVLGGLGGLTHRPVALTRFFVVAPELARLSSEADNLVGVSSGTPRRLFRLSRPLKHKQEQKIQQLRCVLECTNPFQYEGTNLVNLVSKTSPRRNQSRCSSSV